MNETEGMPIKVMSFFAILCGLILGISPLNVASETSKQVKGFNSPLEPVVSAMTDLKKGAMAPGDFDFYPGDHAKDDIIGNSLPGKWRFFSLDSPWNLKIPQNARIHPDSNRIVAFCQGHAASIRFARKYVVPLWVVNSDNIRLVKVQSKRIFHQWDKDNDGLSDIGAPIMPKMWPEPTEDGHMCIVDPFKKISWEFSSFKPAAGSALPQCSTFNIWDLTGSGAADPYDKSKRWQSRGGRGSGFPLVAGMIRPEELSAGEIRHALLFTFPENRRGANSEDIFLPPASRSDGKFIGDKYPVEGMRFQLDPSLVEKDFNQWGLNREGKIVAKALQEYGMFLGDNGGAMALQVQLLAPSEKEHLQKWEEQFPELYKNIQKIPTRYLRIIYSGEPVVKK